MAYQFHHCNAYVDDNAVKDIDGKAVEGSKFTSYRTDILFFPYYTSTVYVSKDIRYSTTTTQQTTRYLYEERGFTFKDGTRKFLDNVTKVGAPFEWEGRHIVPVDRL